MPLRWNSSFTKESIGGDKAPGVAGNDPGALVRPLRQPPDTRKPATAVTTAAANTATNPQSRKREATLGLVRGSPSNGGVSPSACFHREGARTKYLLRFAIGE